MERTASDGYTQSQISAETLCRNCEYPELPGVHNRNNANEALLLEGWGTHGGGGRTASMSNNQLQIPTEGVCTPREYPENRNTAGVALALEGCGTH